MKTIALLVIAGQFVLSVANAQIHLPPDYHSMDDLEEEARAWVPDELTPSQDIDAWYPNLKNYVAENTRYPPAAQETGLEGVVTAEAMVGIDGRLTDVRISDGLSYQCDKEVTRILQNMPAWNPARRNGKLFEQKVCVRVRFRLQPF